MVGTASSPRTLCSHLPKNGAPCLGYMPLIDSLFRPLTDSLFRTLIGSLFRARGHDISTCWRVGVMSSGQL